MLKKNVLICVFICHDKKCETFNSLAASIHFLTRNNIKWLNVSRWFARILRVKCLPYGYDKCNVWFRINILPVDMTDLNLQTVVA